MQEENREQCAAHRHLFQLTRLFDAEKGQKAPSNLGLSVLYRKRTGKSAHPEFSSRMARRPHAARFKRGITSFELR